MTNKEVYEKVLNLVDSVDYNKVFIGFQNDELGLCDLIYTETINLHLSNATFPELYSQRPPITAALYPFWWPIEDRESRKQALLKAIELCK